VMASWVTVHLLFWAPRTLTGSSSWRSPEGPNG